MTATKKASKIQAYRNLTTGEIGDPHRIGTNVGGHDLYSFQEGWEPVGEVDGEYREVAGLKCDRDGNWYVRPR